MRALFAFLSTIVVTYALIKLLLAGIEHRLDILEAKQLTTEELQKEVREKFLGPLEPPELPPLPKKGAGK